MNIDECRTDGSSPTNILEFGFEQNENKIHEAQKPVALIKYLIRLTTREGQTVLDPFMGSGTTSEAAISLNRNFIGFESNPNYHKKSIQRIESYLESTRSKLLT